MNLMDFEATIREMGDQVYFAPNELAKQRVMKTWRANLEKEPTSLLAFQVDEIIREVRKRDNQRQSEPDTGFPKERMRLVSDAAWTAAAKYY